MSVRICLAISRFALAAWVGAAALFVVTGIREVTDSNIDSVTRDRLIMIRFPAYYQFEFALIGAAAVATGIGMMASRGTALNAKQNRRRFGVAFVLVMIAGALAMADRVWVFAPLMEMIDPPGQPRTPQFVRLHEYSKWINLAQVGMSALAAIWLLGTSDRCGIEDLGGTKSAESSHP